MINKFFELNDDFDSIIRKSLNNKEILNIKFIPTGWTNIVYEVETKNENFFFRFPRDEFWSRTIVKDYEFAKFIHNKTDFNTIKLELLYDNNRPYSLHKKIPGVPLAEKMDDLSEEEIEKVSNDVAKFMYQLHNIKYEKDAIFSIKNIGLNLSEFLDELLSVHVAQEDKMFWDMKHNDEINNTEQCLVHGDLNSSNILLDSQNNVTAIIDFGFGGFGNKYDDIARIIGRCPDSFQDSIVKSYESYSKFNLDTHTLKRNIEVWKNIDKSYINYMKKIGIYK